MKQVYKVQRKKLNWMMLVMLLQVCCLAATGWAQSLSGIVGTVTDNAGATVAGGKVTAKNTATGVVSHAVTSSAGTYTITGLVPGPYSVTIAAAGFETSLHEDVIVSVAGQSTVNASLVPGAVDTTVQVTSNAITLETNEPPASPGRY